MNNVSGGGKRRLVVSMNVSLDGFLQSLGQNDFDHSWMHIDEEVHRAFNELAAGADAFLYGRKVYEVMIPYWPDAVADRTKPAYERDYGTAVGGEAEGGVLNAAEGNALEHAGGSGRRNRGGRAPQAGVEAVPPLLWGRSVRVCSAATRPGRRVRFVRPSQRARSRGAALPRKGGPEAC
jgi:RibD C-terminal domain